MPPTMTFSAWTASVWLSYAELQSVQRPNHVCFRRLCPLSLNTSQSGSLPDMPETLQMKPRVGFMAVFPGPGNDATKQKCIAVYI